MSDTFVKALVFETYVRGLQVPSISTSCPFVGSAKFYGDI
jgi:hypothetical protein